MSGLAVGIRAYAPVFRILLITHPSSPKIHKPDRKAFFLLLTELRVLFWSTSQSGEDRERPNVPVHLQVAPAASVQLAPSPSACCTENCHTRTHSQAGNNGPGRCGGRGDPEVEGGVSPRHPNKTFLSLKAWNLLLAAVPFLRNTGNPSPRRFPNLPGSAGRDSHRPRDSHHPVPPIARPLILSTWWQSTTWASSSPLGDPRPQPKAKRHNFVDRGS